jgi:hypothetical protein
MQEAITLPAIRLDHRLGGQALPYQGLNLLAADSGTIGMAANLNLSAGVSMLLPLLHCQRLHVYVCGASEHRSRCCPLDQACQFIVHVSFGHGLANLVAHGPRWK